MRNTYDINGHVSTSTILSLPGSGDGIDTTWTYGLQNTYGGSGTSRNLWKPSVWQWGLPTYAFSNFS